MQKQKTPIENICYLTLNCPPNLLVLRLEPGPPGNSTAGSVGVPTHLTTEPWHLFCNSNTLVFNIDAQETGQKISIGKNK